MIAEADWSSFGAAMGGVVVAIITYVGGRRRGRAETRVTDETVDSIRLDRVLAALDGLGEEATRLRAAVAGCEEARDACDAARRTAEEQVALLRLRNAELHARLTAIEAGRLTGREDGNEGAQPPWEAGPS